MNATSLVVESLTEAGVAPEPPPATLNERLQRIAELCRFKSMADHPHQREFVESPAKRKVVRAGRRGGKTIGAATLAARRFLAGERVLYAAPTQDQLDTFWAELKVIFQSAIEAGLVKKNETRHIIEIDYTQVRIRAKSAWNADTLRGDYGGLLILDEFQLMAEDTWRVVGAPMMLTTNGDAVFIYTPPSARTRSVSKANDKRHASKLFKFAQADKTGNWQTFHFRSRDNPHITEAALEIVSADMTLAARRQELDAIENDEVAGALWTAELIEQHRVTKLPRLARIVVALDPSASSEPTADAAGIIVAGLGTDKHGYVLEDGTLQGSPDRWAKAVVALYNKYQANFVVAEKNNGGEMITALIRTVDPNVPVRLVWASRGKDVRAEPVAALYEQGKVHHVGELAELEDELTGWAPGDEFSPNRLDADVWALTSLMIGSNQLRTGVL